MDMTSDHTARLGITWQVGVASGWGMYGFQIVQVLLRTGGPRPVLFDGSSALPHHPLMDDRLDEARRLQAAAVATVAERGIHPVRPSFPVLHALGNQLGGGRTGEAVHGDPNIGLVFLEDTRLTADAMARAKRYRTIVAGSGWNGEVLRAAGLDNIAVCPQGVEPSVFHPAPRAGALRDRFVVFSGGKLEHRKGQDLVVEAFRRFHARHPEAVLVTAWHNHWPDTARSIARSRWVNTPPTADEAGTLRIADWLLAHGLREDSFRILPMVPQAVAAAIMREADAALFPNRCEGGTNLVAMEALACGVPTILSANTGHLDLVRDVPCYALTRQNPVSMEEAGMGTDGWGESSIDEMLAHLEAIHADRQAARARGLSAAARMHESWSWERRIGDLLAVVAAAAPDQPTGARG